VYRLGRCERTRTTVWWDGLGLYDAVSPAGVTESAKMIYRGYGCMCMEGWKG